eukprot:GGOE01034901.1.p1 GENE.GGOE01034901.1~~GGOE01034901.1.p1  ORF type:complete len:658 (+),score=171.88 GGOE01034901.1:128-2101(+)
MGASMCLAVWSLVLSLWRPSLHHHPLCLFYRFMDPALEAQYVQHSATLWLTILRVFCVVVFILAGQEIFTALSPSDPLFWTLLSICLSSSFLFGLSWWEGSLSYCLSMNTVYICALSGAYFYQLSLDAVYLVEDNMGHIYNDEILWDADVHSKTLERMNYLAGRGLVQEVLLYCVVLWIALSMSGLNIWTVLAHAAVFIACVAGFMINPIVMDKPFGVFYVVVSALAFFCVSILMERLRRSYFLAQTQLARELQASQLADSVLNHMLKNTLADVAADIEIFLAGELGPEVLEDAVVCLRRGLQSCRERMVFLKMVAGEYAPVLSAIGLQEFSQQLVAGSNITTHAPDLTVLMDGTLMQLVLEHAMSNAVKHGHPDHPDVQLIIRKEEPKDSAVNVDGRQLVSFTVQNAAHPLRPRLRADLIHHFLVGETRMQTNTMPALSAGVGLLQCGLAARLGGIALSLCQEGDVVSFTATMEAEVMEATTLTEDDFPLASHFPGGLKIFCLDDSAAMRRLMEFQLKRWCPSAVVRIYGALEDDVHAFMSEALQDADIVILDQNLEYAHPHYGTDLCRQLIRFGFRGLICIRSSDDSQDDQAKYAASGAHCSFGKDVPVAKVVQQLKAAYVLNVLLPTADQSDPALRSLLAPLRFSSGPFPASPE